LKSLVLIEEKELFRDNVEFMPDLEIEEVD